MDTIRLALCVTMTSLLSSSCLANLWQSAVNSQCDGNITEANCDAITKLATPANLEFCADFGPYVSRVNEGACTGIRHCREVFKNRRWNCVTGKVLKVASRETAYVQAVTAAGLLHAVNSGDILPANGTGQGSWQSLQEIVGHGNRFVDKFLRNYGSVTGRKTRRERTLRLMAIHNHKVGALVAESVSRHKCRCRGPSNACELETCWMTFNMTEVARLLKVKYDQAVMARSTRGRISPRSSLSRNLLSEMLVYFESSPDYCYSNWRMSLPGTRGRYCHVDSVGPDGCDILCCGRGHRYVSAEKTFACL